MDSQEKALLENAADDTSKKTYKSKEEILRRATEIVAENETPDKEEIDNLKTTFYKLHIAERDAEQKAYLENGGDPEAYQVSPDPVEDAFKAKKGETLSGTRTRKTRKPPEKNRNHREDKSYGYIAR